MTENDFLQSVVAGMFSMTDDEVASLIIEDGKIKEDAVAIILDKNAKKIKRIQEEAKGDKQKDFDDGYSKGKKQTSERLEKQFFEITGFQSDKTKFEDIVKDFTSTKTKTVSPDDVKSHPLFLELEKNAVPKEKYETLEGEFKSFKENLEKNKVLDAVKAKAWDITSKRNPIQSETPAVAQTRQKDFLKKFDDFNYQEDGNSYLVLKEGKRQEDEHGNPVSFEAHVNALGSQCYDFKAQTDKSNAGNENKPTIVAGEPKSKEEYREFLAGDHTDKEKYDYMLKHKEKFA